MSKRVDFREALKPEHFAKRARFAPLCEELGLGQQEAVRALAVLGVRVTPGGGYHPFDRAFPRWRPAPPETVSRRAARALCAVTLLFGPRATKQAPWRLDQRLLASLRRSPTGFAELQRLCLLSD